MAADGRLPTTLDLYRELRRSRRKRPTPLLHDLFEENTYWELEAEAATARQTAEARGK